MSNDAALEPLLLIVSSPSGAGKTTLCHMLLAEFDRVRFSISHTTRSPRPGEVDGHDYHFVTEEAFEEMVENDLFIEWAVVHGNRYGTARAEIRAATTEGSDLLFDVDYQGARRIKSQYPQSVAVFVLPPTIEVLHERLLGRGTETPEALTRRFHAALDEIRRFEEFDYVLVNDDLAATYEDGLRAIFVAERLRCRRMEAAARKLFD